MKRDNFVLVECPACNATRAVFSDEPDPIKCLSCDTTLDRAKIRLPSTAQGRNQQRGGSASTKGKKSRLTVVALVAIVFAWVAWWGYRFDQYKERTKLYKDYAESIVEVCHELCSATGLDVPRLLKAPYPSTSEFINRFGAPEYRETEYGTTVIGWNRYPSLIFLLSGDPSFQGWFDKDGLYKMRVYEDDGQSYEIFGRESAGWSKKVVQHPTH